MAEQQDFLRPLVQRAGAAGAGSRDGGGAGSGERGAHGEPAGLSVRLLRPDADHAGREAGAAGAAGSAGRFRTELFERYQRSEKALVGRLTEMYVQGVSTRKVKAVTEELCGHELLGVVDQPDEQEAR